MSATLQNNKYATVPLETNYVSQGEGEPLVMIHGIAASLHDWDFLLPEAAKAGYACYALDLLGHGDSAKPASRTYKMDWVFDHFAAWVDALGLARPMILIGHSLGGYLALEYARRFPVRTKALVLVDPFYSNDQLPPLLRMAYRHSVLGGLIADRTPGWLFRAVVDLTSMAMGHSTGALHSLPEEVRAQTALDYVRTAPGVYNLPNTEIELTPYLGRISQPSLVVWGERDQTLAPASFLKLVAALPNARGASIRAGHVPHQSNAEWFNRLTLDFLRAL